MQNIPPPTPLTIRVAFDVVRTRILPLVQRWRLRRVGRDLHHRFTALASAIDRDPTGPRVVTATYELGAFLESKAPTWSEAIEPALLAIDELWVLVSGGIASISTDVSAMTPDEVAEYQAAMAAEGARQAAGLPPSDANGAHCPICAVLERQRERRAS